MNPAYHTHNPHDNVSNFHCSFYDITVPGEVTLALAVQANACHCVSLAKTYDASQYGAHQVLFGSAGLACLFREAMEKSPTLEIRHQ